MSDVRPEPLTDPEFRVLTQAENGYTLRPSDARVEDLGALGGAWPSRVAEAGRGPVTEITSAHASGGHLPYCPLSYQSSPEDTS